MNQDQKFMDFMVTERMQFGYDGWKYKPCMNEEKRDGIYQAYVAVINTLSEDNKKAVEEFCKMLTDDACMESEFFYRYGVKDGYKLCKYIENMSKDDDVE